MEKTRNCRISKKARNYLKMTNIDKKLKKLRLTSKVEHNMNQKSEIWSKIIYKLNFGPRESILVF